MKNVRRSHHQPTTFSVEETDDDFIETEVEETVVPGHAKHMVTAEKVNIEDCAPQSVQIEMANARITEESGGSISPAAVKVSVNLAQMRKSPFWNKNRQKSAPPPKEKRTRVRLAPKQFTDEIFSIDNGDNDGVFALGSKWLITMDKKGNLSNQGKHLSAVILISFVFSGSTFSVHILTVRYDFEQTISSVFVLSEKKQSSRNSRASTNIFKATIQRHESNQSQNRVETVLLPGFTHGGKNEEM